MPALDGLTLRRLEPLDENDVAAAFDAVAADEIAIAGSTEETPDTFRARLAHPLAYAPGHRIAQIDDAVVGVLLAEHDPYSREVFVDVYAVGPHRAEVQRALLSVAVSVAEPLAVGPGWCLRAGALGQDDEYAASLAACDFTAVRRFWRMRRDLAGVPVGRPVAPEGVVRRVAASDEDLRTLHRMFCESFAEHFGTATDRPFPEWIDGVAGIGGADPQQWWIGSLDGDDVAVLILDDSRASLGSSYVRTLGVLPSARGRGIARWLLACADADALERGYTAVALTVDGENTTGATRLYESAGYAAENVIDVWERPLTQ